MTTLYRRLVDLPPGWLPELGDVRTTDEALGAGIELDELGYMVADAGSRRRRPPLVVAVTEEEAEALLHEPDGPVAGALMAWVRSQHRIGPGRYLARPGLHTRRLTLWWDGEPRADVHHRSRSRRSARYTLDADVLAWVAAESARRGESQSDVVQGALRARMAG
jgi:hypothetical protein